MSPTEFTHSPVIPIAAPFDLTDYPELAGISGISGTGLVTRIGVGSYATRTLTGTTNQVNVADGNGVAGNPTISLPQNIHTAATPTFAGITLSGMTSGSVLFAGTGGVVSQDNAGLFYDDAANTLRVGASSTTASSGLIQLATGTTAASGILWGTDTNLYRSAANTLKTDDAFTIADTTASTSSTTGALIVSGGVGAAKDSFFNSIRVGRGTSSIAHNIAIGESSPLGAITTGDRNVAIGSGALGAVTTNHTNTAIGYVAGNAYTGLGSTFIGAYAGFNRVSGDYNVVLGGVVGGAATGAGNVMVGRTAGGLTSGAYNTAVGHGAGGAITSGGSNVCIGESAGYLLSQGGQNVIIGAGSGTGWYSAAPSLTTGSQNIFIGSGSGQSNVSGNYNVSIGNVAGFLSTTSNNIFIGNMAGRYATTQSSELFIDNQNRTNRAGDIAGAIIYGVFNATPASQTLALNAQVSLGSPEQVRVTNTASATRYITLTGSNGGNPTIDVSAGSLAITPGVLVQGLTLGKGNGALANNVAFGLNALSGSNSGTGKNIAIGQSALAANTTGYQNIAIGWEAIKTGATGNGNIAIGHSSQTGVTGAANISVGNGNLAYVGANNYNTAIGHASQDTATSQYNTSVGGLTLRAASGLSNAAVGYQAGTAVSTGYQNTLIGNSAGVGTTTGFQNTFLGYQAGFHNVGGIINTMVGYNAGVGINSGSYNTIIGAAQWTYPTTLNNNIVLADGQGNIKYRYDATNVTYTANSGYHSFVSTGSAEQVRITHTASASRYITLTGSNGGNPTIDVSAGSLAITPATVFASTISALAITGNSFIPNSATIPTNGMYLEAANNPAFAANSTKIFEYDSTGIQIAGTITTPGGATFHTTSTALTNGAGAGAGTLTNAPSAGDPTKWIGINDNGTTRYIPAW